MSKPPSQRIIRFRVPEIMCASCARSIKGVLKNDKRILPKTIYVNLLNNEVSVVIDPNCKTPDREILEYIKSELDSVGFSLKPAKSIWRLILKGAVGTLAGLTLLGLMVSGIALPLFATYLIAGFVSLLTLYLGWDTYQSAVMTFVKTRQLNMDALFTVSTLTALCVSLIALFVPWLPMMFDAALLILGFRQLGIAMEESAKRNILTGLAFCDRIPPTVLKLEDGQEKTVPVESIKKGDVIVVPPNGIVPVDGQCDSDRGAIHKTIYNGDLDSVSIARGDSLLGGSRVADTSPALRVIARKSFDESYLARTDKYIDEIQKNHAPIEKTTDKILSYFVPAVFCLAIFSGLTIGLLFGPALAILCMVGVLVVACPCTLGFIVPLAVNIGIRKGQEQSVTFKGGGQALEAASKVTAVVFDLNGTLTQDSKDVSQIKIVDRTINRSNIIDYIYLLEKKAAKKQHAVARAIYRYAKTAIANEHRKPPLMQVTQQQNDYAGVRGIIDGECYTLGNATLMKRYGIALDRAITKSFPEADQVIYLARGKEVIAMLCVTDPIRPDAKQVVSNLMQSGKSVYICTGSDRKTAEHYADQLSIPRENIRCNCVPYNDPHYPRLKEQQTKVEVVHALQKKGHQVAFVGDGGNDAAAISDSLGIVMKSEVSDSVTEDRAGIVIHSPMLRPLLAVFEVSKQTMHNIKVSLGVSIAYNMITLPLACGLFMGVGFMLNPALGALLMVLGVGLLLGIAYHYKQKSVSLGVVSKPKTASNSTSLIQAKQTERPLRRPSPRMTVVTNPLISNKKPGRQAHDPHLFSVVAPTRNQAGGGSTYPAATAAPSLIRTS